MFAAHLLTLPHQIRDATLRRQEQERDRMRVVLQAKVGSVCPL